MEIREETFQALEAQQAKRENKVDEVIMSDSICNGLMYETCTRKTKSPLEVKETESYFSTTDTSVLRAIKNQFPPSHEYLQPSHAITWRKAELFWSFVAVVPWKEGFSLCVKARSMKWRSEG